MDNNLLISGSNGFGSFSLPDGSNQFKIKTLSGGIVQINSSRNKVLIQPKPNYGASAYPIDGAYYFIDMQSGELSGTLGTAGNRKGVRVAPNYEHLFVLTKKKIMMYSTK